MERFSETSPADLIANYNRRRFHEEFEDAAHAALSVPCPNCQRQVSPSEIRLIANGWDFEGCAECAAECELQAAREDAHGQPLCPVEYERIVAARSISEVLQAIETHAHEACAYCQSRKPVASERRAATQKGQAA